MVKVGDKFSKWTVIAEPYRAGKGYCKKCKCRCECGNEQEVYVGNLTGKKSKACRSCAYSRHGMYKSKIYSTWRGIKTRCKDKNSVGYKNYGGRGIRVCDAWDSSFEVFYEWAMSNGYKEGLSIERIDPNGDYCPENCIWIPKSDQPRNTRKNRNNTSGVTGVQRGSKGPHTFWVATSNDKTGKVRSKLFTINKYGEELAFFLACEYRELMIERLKLQGVYYGEHHGK